MPSVESIIQEYIEQRDQKEIIQLQSYRLKLAQLNIDGSTIEKLLIIMENEWYIIDHLRIKVKESKSHVIIRLLISESRQFTKIICPASVKLSEPKLDLP